MDYSGTYHSTPMALVRRVVMAVCIGIGLLILATPLAARPPLGLPEDGGGTGPAEPIRLARATWDTGWFQTEIYRQLIAELGYAVTEPVTMDNAAFYRAAAEGRVHLWVNGWFPLHEVFLEAAAIRENVELVGTQVDDGAMQGYLIDRETAEAHGIDNIADFADPAIARRFDIDGNGLADLIGCMHGWGCERFIDHHLAAYGLEATVEHVKGDYSLLIAETVARYRRGDPVFFYTWTPNWTVGKMVPGRDVIWLEVPFPSLPGDRSVPRAEMSVSDLAGCGSDPCLTGFPPNDIQVVANRDFLDGRPDLRRLLERVSIPIEDISRQNARMVGGEDEESDIRKHAHQWIREHQHQVAEWIHEARALVGDSVKGPPLTPATSPLSVQPLRVATKRFEPFVIYDNRRYTGFSIELWELIADELGVTYELYGVNTVAKLLDELERGAADVSIAGIGITYSRETELDFSHPFFESGLQIMVRETTGSLMADVIRRVFAVLFSRELVFGVGIFLVFLLIAAHIIWILERRHNPEFPRSYVSGLWSSLWWAVVTVTTVGYGDKTPRGNTGRLFGVVWILVGYFVFAYFYASVTSTVTVQELHGAIEGPQDLFGKKIATVDRSAAGEFVSRLGLHAMRCRNEQEAFEALESEMVDAIVYDAPVLQHYASTDGRGKVRVVGVTFQEQSYGIALQPNSPYRELINRALLKITERGDYREIHERWFE